MPSNSLYRTTKKIIDSKSISCVVYYMSSGKVEEKHFHDGIEIVYVIKGNCKTHKQGKVYYYKKGQGHGVINDSKKELIFACLQIPAETEENTHLL